MLCHMAINPHLITLIPSSSKSPPISASKLCPCPERWAFYYVITNALDPHKLRAPLWQVKFRQVCRVAFPEWRFPRYLPFQKLTTRVRAGDSPWRIGLCRRGRMRLGAKLFSFLQSKPLKNTVVYSNNFARPHPRLYFFRGKIVRTVL